MGKAAIPSPSDQTKWVEIAQSLKPLLLHSRRDPVSVVEMIPDAAACQGWSAKQSTSLSALAGKELTAGDSFVLDFGEHCVGYLHLDVHRHGSGDAPTRLRFTFGEMPAEVAEPLEPYKGSLSRSWLQDEVINIDVVPAAVTLPRRYAFRFVKIEIICTSSSFNVSIPRIWCDCVSSAPPIDQLPPSSHLASLSDEMRAIDRISLHTLRDCMQTVFEDGPKRDRRLWIGDLRLQALTNYVSFRNFDLVKRCLYLHAGLLRDDGMVPACVYETPSPRIGANFIIDYAAFFAPTLLEFAQASNDIATAKDLWPVALWQTELLKSYIDEDGSFTNFDGGWVFIDWHPKLHKDTAAIGALIFGLRKTIALAELVGSHGVIAPLQERIQRMSTAAKRHAFDDKYNLFVSGPDRQVSWMTQAWMVLAGVVESDQAARVLSAVAADPSAIKPATPYGWHYVVEAMTLCGMKAQATKIVQDYWGAMVRLGADTFWEAFDPANPLFSPYNSHLINSYCHAWSCTPAYFIRTGFAR